MPKANPKAWFTSPIAKITFRKVDKWAQYNAKIRPYFPSWGDAHRWMLTKAEERLKRAKSELESAIKHLQKIRTMEEPTAQAATHAKGGDDAKQ